MTSLDHGRAQHTDPLEPTRTPMIGILVVDDLIDLAKQDKRWTETLLWQQDQYVTRALRLFQAEITQAREAAIDAGSDPLQAMRRVIVDKTREMYDQCKANLRHSPQEDLLKAAETLLEVEGQTYGMRLKELEELLAKAIEKGDKIVIENLARHAYVAAGRLEQVESALTSLGEKSRRAVELATQISAHREEVNFIAIAESRSPAVGRELFKAVQRIHENPSLYIQWQRKDDERLNNHWKGALSAVRYQARLEAEDSKGMAI